MSIGTGKRNSLSVKQAKALRLMKNRMLAGEDMSRDLLIECHDLAYELGGDRKLASTYGGQNMKRAAFLAGLTLDAPESQHVLKDVLWQWLLEPNGSEKKAIAAAKLLAGAALGQKHSVSFDEGEFTNKSAHELDYFAKHGHWPKVIEGNETIQ